jgi:HEAT repeat protein
VWATRGLLHVWDDVATDAIIDATAHEAWRVREMAAKVIARQHVRPAIDAVVMLLEDENARVRTAASRAFRIVAES